MYAVVYKVILRTGLFDLIEIGSNYDAWCWGYDFFNTFTILLNLAVSIMYTFDNMEMKYGPLLLTLERLTVAFFAIDFLLRVFTAKYLYPDVSEPRAVWKYLISFSGIWWAASTLLTVGYGDISRHSIIVLVRRHQKLIISGGNLTLLEGNCLIGILSDYFQSAIDGFSCSMLESIQIRRHLRFYPKHRVDFSGSMLLKSDYFSPHNYPLR